VCYKVLHGIAVVQPMSEAVDLNRQAHPHTLCIFGDMQSGCKHVTFMETLSLNE
jgi:hypothetical protein